MIKLLSDTKLHLCVHNRKCKLIKESKSKGGFYSEPFILRFCIIVIFGQIEYQINWSRFLVLVIIWIKSYLTSSFFFMRVRSFQLLCWRVAWEGGKTYGKKYSLVPRLTSSKLHYFAKCILLLKSLYCCTLYL